MNRIVSVVAIVVLFSAGCGKKATSTTELVTFRSCLASMTNLYGFVEGPRGTPGLITTYDQSGGNSDWARGLKPAADGLYTIADLKGPGCVWRVWMTGIKPEAWYFFFDGEESARIKLDGHDLFEQVPPFLAPLNDMVSGGAYSYTPLPYAKSLRIAVGVKEFTPAMRFYHHINYETFSEATQVESFPVTLTAADQEQLDVTRKAWRTVPDEMQALASQVRGVEEQELPSGKAVVIADRTGGGVVTSVALRVKHASQEDAVAREALLREVVIRMFWDKADKPSVEVPLGDFFCNGLRDRPFASMPLSYVDGAYVCRFPMPFTSGMKMELRNDGDSPLSVKAAVAVGELPVDVPVNYFHAAWRGRRENGRPLQLLLAQGKGHYVGCYLTALGMQPQWNILEGDESIRVDNKLKADFHGTGLEDYFNGAWYYYGIFDLPLHGLLEKAAMRTSQYRFHLNDGVRFSKAISVQFEFGHGNTSRGYMSGTAFWYADTPSESGSWIPSVAERYAYPDPLERASFMAGLFEIEREGLLAQARDRCLSYAKRYAKQPESDIVRLRAAAYAGALGDVDAAKEEYVQIAQTTANDQAKQEAASLLWMGESPAHALIGAHVNGRYKLYVDGKLQGEGDDPTRLVVTRTSLSEGMHTIALEVTPTRPMPWMSACVKTVNTNITSDLSWRVMLNKPAGWPANTVMHESDTWQSASSHGFFPLMYYWQFYPNAMVMAQSAKQILYAPGTWMQGNPAYFRGEFRIGAPAKQ